MEIPASFFPSAHLWFSRLNAIYLTSVCIVGWKIKGSKEKNYPVKSYDLHMWVFRKVTSILKSEVSYEFGKTILLKQKHRQKLQDALYCVKMSI